MLSKLKSNSELKLASYHTPVAITIMKNCHQSSNIKIKRFELLHEEDRIKTLTSANHKMMLSRTTDGQSMFYGEISGMLLT